MNSLLIPHRYIKPNLILVRAIFICRVMVVIVVVVVVVIVIVVVVVIDRGGGLVQIWARYQVRRARCFFIYILILFFATRLNRFQAPTATVTSVPHDENGAYTQLYTRLVGLFLPAMVEKLGSRECDLVCAIEIRRLNVWLCSPELLVTADTQHRLSLLH